MLSGDEKYSNFDDVISERVFFNKFSLKMQLLIACGKIISSKCVFWNLWQGLASSEAAALACVWPPNRDSKNISCILRKYVHTFL